MDINKIKLPDDWAKDYESPVTVQIRKIAEQIEEQRENELILKISEQMGVNIDKDELTRALAYDRDQYRRGYEDGWRARSKEVPQWVPITYKKLTDEEKEEMREVADVDIIDAVYTCPLPDDGQKVLITTRAWRSIEVTTFYNDVDGAYFEDWEDIDEVAAWMPLMEPYKEEGETND